MIETSPMADSQIDRLCRAPMALITWNTAATNSRMPRITCRAITGLENSPIDFFDVGAVPYRL